MKQIYYLYNNEAIATSVLLSLITKLKEIEIAFAPLVLPFLLDNRTVNHLSKDNVSYAKLEEFIQSRQIYFSTFNNRFLSLLPITINALMILYKSCVIRINDKIILNKKIELETEELGNRFTKIESVIPKFITMIKDYSPTDLYILLNIQL